MRMLPVEPTEGLCEICRQRPVEYMGLVCQECRGAIERNEEWLVDHQDVLFRLQTLESEEDVMGS